MPYGDYQGRNNRNQYYRDRDLYYNFNSRSTYHNVQIGSESDGEHIDNNFCPIHGQVAQFDRYVSRKYIYPCCMREVPNEVMDIEVKEVGISTIDGRTSSDPRYGRTSETGGGGIIVPADSLRQTHSNRRMVQLSPEDEKLRRKGYQIIQSQEKIADNANLLNPQLSGSSHIDNYRRNPLEDKQRRIHGLGHLK